jgi:ABC-2 type transport system permease protein
MSEWPPYTGLLAAHVRYQNVLFLRTPIAAFFSTALPLIMLVLFVAVFGNDTFGTSHGEVTTAQFYAPSLAVFAIASATFTNIAIFLSTQRDEGVLKRHRGTPLPTSALIGGVIGSAVIIAAVSAALMIGIGFLAYDLQLEAAKLPAVLLSFAVGTMTFAAMGVALAVFAPSANSAPALANATILPMAIMSGIFINQGQDAPGWLTFVGDIFPLRQFVEAFSAGFSPFTEAPAIEWDRLAVLAVWGLAAGIYALRNFTWEIRGATSRRSGRRSATADALPQRQESR